MKPRFEPDVDPAVRALPTSLIDPEGCDVSEQQFAASLEEDLPRPRFAVDQKGDGPLSSQRLESGTGLAPQERNSFAECQTVSGPEQPQPLSLGRAPENAPWDAPPSASLAEQPSSDAWREEVAARVNHYRTRRRRREPRYPSLQLKFDSSESSWNRPPGASRQKDAPSASRLAVVPQDEHPDTAPSPEQPMPAPAPVALSGGDGGAKIIEFPGFSTPPLPLDDLAEPVFDRPRIFEVPEVLPPPPALGGILIEPAEEPVAPRRPGFELPLQAASMSRRLLAAAIDALLVSSALAFFAYVFLRITSSLPPWREAVSVSAVLLATLWASYQYLLLVYAGTTPGLTLAKLQLSRFDGSPVPRRVRRWRVLASVLSSLSLALGYAWCFLDEDELCWHDRITRTYMAPESPLAPKSPK